MILVAQTRIDEVVDPYLNDLTSSPPFGNQVDFSCKEPFDNVAAGIEERKGSIGDSQLFQVVDKVVKITSTSDGHGGRGEASDTVAALRAPA